MAVSFQIKKKITVNGREYESLDEIPAEFRAAFEKALELGAKTATGKVVINGRTYATLDEVPAPLRAAVRGIATMAVKSGLPSESPAETGPTPIPVAALRPEPIISSKMVFIALGIAGLLVWLISRM